MKTILIVDDEPVLREIIKEVLEVEQFNVMEAENGRKALEIVKNNKIDCIVSDIRMPGGSGIELAKSLFAMPPPKPEIILMTGYSDFTEEQAKEFHVSKLISKPFEPDYLIQEIKNVIHKS